MDGGIEWTWGLHPIKTLFLVPRKEYEAHRLNKGLRVSVPNLFARIQTNIVRTSSIITIINPMPVQIYAHTLILRPTDIFLSPIFSRAWL